ncbi:L,D-transpeptidase [Notoacmeibacter ruber]|uniref:L,D-transpeptidase n=1 Tax=Notoacmeibacter ruber TaxID=2670375 RepID=A0A3L7JAN7_9HYPH|nr:L,D-transpeptidase [Notoacmeibacter ruber]RLQ87504.1 L,D-transpeptidase [Notoacmeibacter ruber]
MLKNKDKNAEDRSRRAVLGGLLASGAALGLAGCSTSGQGGARTSFSDRIVSRARQFGGSSRVDYASAYASTIDEGYVLPAIPWQQIDRRYLRSYVPNTTGEGPNKLIVDTDNHFVYFTRPDGMAWRYGVGLGREGFAWSGRAVMQWKKKWPTWTPPDEMIARQPELAKYSADNGGMEPGLTNPLGARALYIFKDGQDTLYRLHGSPEWRSIGKNVSSGCVRLMNQDIIHLYDQVPNGTPILVTSGLAAPTV